MFYKYTASLFTGYTEEDRRDGGDSNSPGENSGRREPQTFEADRGQTAGGNQETADKEYGNGESPHEFLLTIHGSMFVSTSIS